MGKRRASPFEAPPHNREGEGNRKARRKQAVDALTTMGMLLGAKWVSGGAYFESKRPMPLPSQYWDRRGNPLTSIQVAIRSGVTPRGNEPTTFRARGKSQVNSHSADALAYAYQSRPRRHMVDELDYR